MNWVTCPCVGIELGFTFPPLFDGLDGLGGVTGLAGLVLLEVKSMLGVDLPTVENSCALRWVIQVCNPGPDSMVEG